MFNLNTNTNNCKGITLLELLVTLAIASTLLLAGSFLTVSWTDRDKVNNTVAIIKSSIANARALAIRNEALEIRDYRVLLSDEPSVSICIDYEKNTLEVLRILDVSNICKKFLDENLIVKNLIKNYSIAKGIEIKQGDNLVNCFVLNASGLINKSFCQTTLTDEITVRKGNEEFNFKLL